MVADPIIQVYDSELHEYTIILKTSYGEFAGKATCSPEDYNHESTMEGFSIAEARAEIEKYKFILKVNKKEYKTLSNFYKSLKCYADFDDNSTEAKKIRRQLFLKERDIRTLKDMISNQKVRINSYIKDCEDAAKKADALKSKKD